MQDAVPIDVDSIRLDQELPHPDDLAEGEITDLASDFIEGEVGRFDWKNNWEVLRKQPETMPRLARWLGWLGVKVDPKRVADRIDQMSEKHGGSRWL